MAWMTAKEAADYSRRHPETVRNALREGTLRGVQPSAGSDWRTKDEWVDEWIMAPRVKVKRAA